MKERLQPLATGALIGTALAMPAGAADSNFLGVSADTPVVSVSTRPEGRNFMRLPALEYAFVIESGCRATLMPASMSLSIADTRISMSGDDLGDEPTVEVTLLVPAGQIGPVAVERFCVVTDQANGLLEQTTRIPAILSAQAALICSSETASEIVYASTSLDVILNCEAETPPEATDTP